MSEEERTNLWRDEIEKLVAAGFATVSRNPSDYESAIAYRKAIDIALRMPPPSEVTP